MKIKTLILFLLLALSYTSFSQAKDTLYFDAKWKKTTKENHQYFRPLPLKVVDSLSLIRDYYKNGKLQMQGYVYTHNNNLFAGDLYIYTKDGYDSSFTPYINTTNKPLTYYHNNGTVWKTNAYQKDVKDGKIDLYNDLGDKIGSETYSSGNYMNDTISKFVSKYYATNKNKQISFNRNAKEVFKPVKAVYHMKTGKLAQVSVFKKRYEIINQKTYAQSGRLIKAYNKNDFSGENLTNGIDYRPITTNGFVVGIDRVPHTSQSSQIIKINDIDVLNVYDYGKLDFFKKIASNQYQLLNYRIVPSRQKKEERKLFLSKGFHTYNLYDRKRVYDKNCESIPVKDIKEQSVSELLGLLKKYEWSSTYFTVVNRKDSTAHKISFKQLNNQVFTEVDRVFGTNEMRDFRALYIPKNDNISKWYIYKSKLYAIQIFLINKTKPILIFSVNGSIEHAIIPMKDNTFYTTFKDWNKNKPTMKSYESLNDANLKFLMANATQKFYKILKKDNKQFIANIYNEIVVKKPYDTIQMYNEFIIGDNKNQIDIYNTLLHKLPIENSRQVYYDRGNLQILTDKKVFYVDPLGKEAQRNDIKNFLECGFDEEFHSKKFKIIKTKAKKPLNAIVESTVSGTLKYTIILSLKNLDTSFKVTFLNRRKEDHYGSNNNLFLDDGYINQTNVLVVSKNKKFGLYTYNYNNVAYEKKKSKSKKNVDEDGDGGEHEPPEAIAFNAPLYGNTSAKEILPVVYDSIKLNEPLIIVEKDNSYGILDKTSTIPELKYRTLGKVHNNFMPYEKLNGEKGWIDVRSLQEFLKQ